MSDSIDAALRTVIEGLRAEDEEIREIYRCVRSDGHGDFLSSFAQAVLMADHENFIYLRPPALFFIHKYGLKAERSLSA